MRPRPWPLLLLAGCAQEPVVPIDPACVPPSHTYSAYLKKADLELDRDWYYRRTVVESGGSFEGVGDLSRVRLVLEEERLVARRAAETLGEWPVAHVDLECMRIDDEARLVPTAARPFEEREYVQIAGPRVRSQLDLSTRTGWDATFAPSSELLDRRRTLVDHLDFVESGALSVSYQACEALFGPLAAPVECGSEVRVRHVLSPADEQPYQALPAADAPFQLFASNGFVERFAPGLPLVFHLGVDFPDVDLGALEAQLSSALGEVSILPNTCRREEIARAMQTPHLFEAARVALCGTEACDDPLQRLSPAKLTQVCDAMEATDPIAFAWQRPGDLRFNTLAWQRFELTVGWGAHSVRAVDAENGRIVAADLILDGGALEQIADEVRGHRADGDDAPEALVALAAKRDAIGALDRVPVSAAEVDRLAALGELDRSPTQMLARIELANGAPAYEGGDDLWFPAILVGPTWDGFEPFDPELARYSKPGLRVELMIDAAGHAALAELADAGFSFMSRRSYDGAVAIAASLGASEAEEAYRLTFEGLVRHTVAHALLHALGLADNPAASFDALNYPAEAWAPAAGARHLFTASVLDLVPAEERPFVVELGRYDVAALRYVYRGEVEVFDAPLAEDPFYADYTRIPQIATSARSFVPSADAVSANLVPHRSCSAEAGLVRPTFWCAADDWGANAREVYGHAHARWLGHYHSLNVVDNASTFDATAPARAAIEAFARASIAAQHAAHLARTRSDFASTDLARDLLTAALAGGNFAAELISTPALGRLCPWPGTDPMIFLPAVFLGCDPSVPIDSPQSLEEQQIEPPRGIARDTVLGDSVSGAPWERVGVYFDQVNALWALGVAFPTELPAGAARISVADLLEPEVSSLFERMMKVNPLYVRSETAEDLGQWWCADQARPDDAHLGSPAPPRLIDLATGASLPASPSGCARPGVVFPTGGALLRLVLFYDRALQIGPSVDVYRIGIDDTGVDWAAHDPADICSFTDLQGAESRALASESPTGCLLLLMATDARNEYEAGPPDDVRRDLYEWWLDRLDEARMLRALYPR